MSVWAVVVGGGSGLRYGGPKQFEHLAGKAVIERALAPAVRTCDGVVVVVPHGHPAEFEGVAAVVEGGPTRSDSVRAGLKAVPDDAEVVVVHDAVRPLASPALFEAVVAAVRDGADGAVPGLGVADTLKRVAGGRVSETVDRSDLVRAQTPQAFRASVLRAAHLSCPEASDDAAVVEAAGGSVAVVPGDPANIKITEPSDLLVAEALMRR
jgi:2-C-methyl-D-erythritol 4-phosphate cytidylyltransferase